MLKVNRRKEIKEKEDFQLKFQLAISANNANVLNWLPQTQENESREGIPTTNSKDLFLDLPVISGGAGLFELDRDGANNDSPTIGSFLNSENIPQKLNTGTARDVRTGSKAMSALMNKMRSDSRKNVAEKYQIKKERTEYRPRLKIMEDMKKQKQKQPSKSTMIESMVHDSDEEESKSKQIYGKKTAVPQFGKKNKGRPF
ncbi:hypothetical protein METBIDRAFT_46672 [Metschnikowia bicuspidata var. bicuspidata NRRL YB-4993]|uniref:Uncharacterized protein n=1 Tax=Metschnikowia bicuspidata var. bicuspidata NRRL YB-4993 TaxID=869754 RepID=A0A1A0H609_9ASCO|nr:hypothetical protein METBIDRAFT_46672 [Metschnikowia bicuspidata var. bicuspidata NRRL YB-4993]OBA19342.1 hypothetical protein METBIDRAFT_46672 [Metschnikowia bicuspidata var. bicuspidata NRRL YB-4993]